MWTEGLQASGRRQIPDLCGTIPTTRNEVLVGSPRKRNDTLSMATEALEQYSFVGENSYLRILTSRDYASL